MAASAQAKSSGVAVTVVAATDAENEVVANTDGSFTRSIAAVPVRVQQSGTWVPLDATLQHNSDGTWSTAATSATLVLSGGGPAGSTLAAMDDQGQDLAFTWPTALPAPTVTGSVALYADVLPDVDLQLTANLQGGFTDLVIVRSQAGAENPALASLTLGTTTSVDLTLSADAAGDISATDTAGQLVYRAPAPSMYDSTGLAGPTGSASATAARAGVHQALAMTAQDSTPTPSPSAIGTADAPAVNGAAPAPVAGDQSAPVAVQVTSSAVTLTPDQSLLTSSNLVFPLVIDPGFTPELAYSPVSVGASGSVSHYTYLQAGCGDQDNFDANTQYDTYGLGAGYQGFSHCQGVERALYEFNLGSALAGADVNILGATLTVDETYIAWSACDSSNNQGKSAVSAYYTTTRLSNSLGNSMGRTWNNFNTVGTKVDTETIGGANRTGCAGNYSSGFQVKNAVAATTDGHITLELRGLETSSDANSFKRFAKTGTLAVTYNTTPRVPTTTTVTPTPASPTSQGCTTDSSQWGWIPGGGTGGSVLLAAKVADPDASHNQEVQGQFSLKDITSGAVLIAQGNTSASTDDDGWAVSGTSVSKSVAASTLTDGHTYTWTVRTYDGFTTSANATACSFKYDATAPTGLTVDGSPLGTGQCVAAADSVQGTPRTVALQAGDAGSGVSHFAYSWQDSSSLAADGGTKIPYNGGAGTATGSLSFTPTSWGAYTLWLDVSDKAGNQSSTGCYTFNVTANHSAIATPGDVTGDKIPDVVTADANGNLDAWPTGSANGAHVQISNNSNGVNLGAPGPGGSWAGALVTHRLPAATPQRTYIVDDLWALRADRTALFLYQNSLNLPGSTNTANFTTSHYTGPIGPCDNAPAGCNGHRADWSQVNQLLSVGDMNNDTYPDLVTEEAGGNIWFFPGTSTAGVLGTPSLLSIWASRDNWTLIAPGNTPNDGGVAQLWGRDNDSGKLYTWAITNATAGGNPTWGAQTQIGIGYPASTYPQIMSEGDTNGDSLPDLLATTAAGALVEQSNTGTSGALFDGTVDGTHPGPGQLQPNGWTTALTGIEGPTAAPFAVGGYHQAVTATRILDTRDPDSLGNVVGGTVTAGSSTVTGGSTTSLQISNIAVTPTGGGPARIPASVTAVAIDITIANQSGSGYVTAYPDGSARPVTSSANYPAATTVTGYQIVPVGSNGRIDVYTGGSPASTAALIIDATGYFTRDSTLGGDQTYTPLPATTVALDTRTSTTVPGPITSGSAFNLKVTGANGVPAGATAVAANLTITGQTGKGFLEAYATGTTPTALTSLTYTATGSTASMAADIPLNSNGSLTISNQGSSTDVLVSIAGYYTTSTTGQTYHTLTPTRLADTRNGTDGTPTGTLAAHGTYTLTARDPLITNAPTLPTLSTTITVTDATANGYLIAYPGSSPTLPTTASNLNWTSGTTTANLALTPTDTNDQISIYNSSPGTIDLVIDCNGYYA